MRSTYLQRSTQILGLGTLVLMATAGAEAKPRHTTQQDAVAQAADSDIRAGSRSPFGPAAATWVLIP